MSERYSRQTLFPQIGHSGQAKLREKHVLIIGAGALGSGSAEMMTRAGVGRLTIIDRDYVEESNLQRQQLYTEEDVREKLPKAAAAGKRLKAINSDVDIQAFIADATPKLMEELVRAGSSSSSQSVARTSTIDLILDATDNFETRMMINDISQKYNIPWIYGACVGSYGMSFTIVPGMTPCLNCLLKAIPIQGMTCDTGGIIAPAVGMVIAHQGAEALKILVEDWEALRPGFVSFDLWRNQYSSMKMSKAKDASCLSCGDHPTYPYLDVENMTKSTVLCGRDTVQIRPPKQEGLNLAILSEQLTALGYEVKANPYLLSVEYEGTRMVIFGDGRALVHGTKDLNQAKSLYQRLLG